MGIITLSINIDCDADNNIFRLEGNVILCLSNDNSYNVDSYSGNWSQICTNNNNNNNNSNSSCIIQYDSTSESVNNEIYATDGTSTVSYSNACIFFFALHLH